ncbi:RNA-binding protein 33-like [Mercenaria mercenaria]|uniref:RNA-binding protein 33-like n=1 Tax=Mercenaria mercenaria TaxID=6596 RepID=UPI00234F9D6B|nr:RNA-binding protein 33-like [Mercenaria mercenaria]
MRQRPDPQIPPVPLPVPQMQPPPPLPQQPPQIPPDLNLPPQHLPHQNMLPHLQEDIPQPQRPHLNLHDIPVRPLKSDDMQPALQAIPQQMPPLPQPGNVFNSVCNDISLHVSNQLKQKIWNGEFINLALLSFKQPEPEQEITPLNNGLLGFKPKTSNEKVFPLKNGLIYL